MAYTKTTWNNLSNPPINADNLNKIEQGIYNNSLGIDKINPSGTATTTAEIEEGQINDVIGFKSLKLKGQTSQYTTTGKNKFDGVFRQGSTSATNATNRICSNNDLILTSGTTYTISTNLNLSNYKYAIVLSDVAFPHATSSNKYDSGWKTATFSFTPEGDYYFAITIGTTNGTDNITPSILNGIWFQLETGSSATSYEKYSGGKASPNPDFPQDVNNVSGDNVVRISNKNLYDKDDSNLIMNNVYINATGFVLTASNNMKTICMPCRANTTYTVSKTLSSRFIIGTASSNTIGTSMTAGRTNPSGTQVSVTSGANDKYLFVFYYHGSADTKTEQEIRNSIQVEIGTSATSYIAHQGNNFDIDLPVENLLNLTNGTYTNNGIEALVRDGEIILNGTASANSFVDIPITLMLTANQSYTMEANNDKTIGGTASQSYGCIRLRTSSSDDGETDVLFNVQNNAKVITKSSNTTYANFRIRTSSGLTYNNYVIKPQLEKGLIGHNYTHYGVSPIELCKISTYQDYIYKKDGKWYKHKIIQKTIFDGTEEWRKSGNTSVDRFWLKLYNGNVPSFHNMFSNKFNYQYNVSNLNVAWIDAYQAEERLFVNYTAYGTTTLEQFQEWLATAKPIFYYPLATPIEEEITYTPLIRQLDELYNSGLYDVTNISQDNSSEAFILDIEACKNNINGIVEYIRR